MTGHTAVADDLLRAAREDLAVAEAAQQVEGISARPIGFHAQQAVEKALKAVLASRAVEFPFIHDLGRLFQLCDEHGVGAPSDLLPARRLTPYAGAIRYGTVDPDIVDILDAIRWAADTIEWAAIRVDEAR
jgi:HEPN domain-containing protein